MEINLNLILADINELGEFDFVLMGHKNRLLPKVVDETKGHFEVIEEKGLYPHKWQLLRAEHYKWKNVGVITFHSRVRLSESPSSRITDALSCGMNNLNCTTFALLPLSCRNPHDVALAMVYSLWLFGYMSLHGITQKNNKLTPLATFNVVSSDSIDPFLEILDDDAKQLWDFIKLLCAKQTFTPEYEDLRKTDILIKWRKILI
jgi:hypothetical protein